MATVAEVLTGPVVRPRVSRPSEPESPSPGDPGGSRGRAGSDWTDPGRYYDLIKHSGLYLQQRTTLLAYQILFLHGEQCVHFSGSIYSANGPLFAVQAWFNNSGHDSGPRTGPTPGLNCAYTRLDRKERAVLVAFFLPKCDVFPFRRLYAPVHIDLFPSSSRLLDILERGCQFSVHSTIAIPGPIVQFCDWMAMGGWSVAQRKLGSDEPDCLGVCYCFLRRNTARIAVHDAYLTSPHVR